MNRFELDLNIDVDTTNEEKNKESRTVAVEDFCNKNASTVNEAFSLKK